MINWNLLLYKEAYHIKRLTPFLNNGLKASRELRLFSWQFRFFVFHFHVIILLHNLAVFKFCYLYPALVRRWYRFISKYYKHITSFSCICCLSSLVTMQLLGIAFILYLLKLSAGNGFCYKALAITFSAPSFAQKYTPSEIPMRPHPVASKLNAPGY